MNQQCAFQMTKISQTMTDWKLWSQNNKIKLCCYSQSQEMRKPLLSKIYCDLSMLNVPGEGHVIIMFLRST